MIPPKENSEFVARMEDILDLYHRPYDPQCPLICMDEQPYQFLDHTREPISLQPGIPFREDYQYQRMGTCSIFMFTEPMSGRRYVDASPRRTKKDWAQHMAHILDTYYSHVEKAILVMDNLNTHVISSFYEVFPPEKARALVKKLEIHYTPKHGSWLNIAEIELSVLTKQCLDRRIQR